MRPLLVLSAVAICAAGCRSYDATELVVEVRTKNFQYPPDPPPYGVDELEVRVLRLVGSGDLPDGSIADASRDAAPADASPTDAAATDAGPDAAADAGAADSGVADASSGEAGVPDAGPTDASVDASPVAMDAGAGGPLPCRPDLFDDTGYMYVEKWCGRYRLPIDGVPPIILGVVPDDGDESTAIVEIRATAYLEGDVVVKTRRLAAFAPHRRVYLPPLVLSAGCVDRTCQPGETCNADYCVPALVPPACLEHPGEDGGVTWSWCGFDGSVPVGDAGPPPDAAVDGDAGDAGDAGDVDGGGCECTTAGSVETGTGGGCNCTGTQGTARTCDGCHWSAWTNTGCSGGGCRPGAYQPAHMQPCGGGTGWATCARTCQSDCTWSPSSCCP